MAGITTSEVAVKLILAPDAIVKSVPSEEIFSPPAASYKYNFAAPPKTKSSVDASHNIKALAASPKNFTSCPASSTPTVSVPS